MSPSSTCPGYPWISLAFSPSIPCSGQAEKAVAFNWWNVNPVAGLVGVAGVPVQEIPIGRSS